MMDFDAFLKALEPYNNIAITAPAGADGDSVGTQCSLQEILLQLFPSKKIRVINEEPCPNRYKFLKGAETFEVSKDLLNSPARWPEVMICVDGGASRIGEATTQIWKAAKARGQVDHHAIGGATNDYQFRLYDPQAAATTVVIFRMLRTLKIKLTPSIAQAIYVGLIFDTGLFKHSNTKPETMRIGADLLETGFDHTATVEKALLMRSTGAFQMMKHVVGDAHFDLGGRYVWGVLDQKTFLAAGGNADDREGLIDQLFLTESCEIAALYFERFPNEWKMSFRSRKCNVAKLAQSLNPSGGGHVQAAGCSLEGTQDVVLAKCHKAVKECLNA
jgi:phosphoesterase RecJ-like protein